MRFNIITPNKKEVEKIADIFQDENPIHKENNSRCCVQGDWLVGTYFSNLDKDKINSNTLYIFDFKKMVKPESEIIFLNNEIKSESGIEHTNIEISKSSKIDELTQFNLLKRQISQKKLNQVFPKLTKNSFIEELISNYCISSGDLSTGGLFEKSLELFNLNIKKNQVGDIKSFIAYNKSQIQIHNIEELITNENLKLQRYIGTAKIEYLSKNNPLRIKAKLEIPFYLVNEESIVTTITKTITCAGLEQTEK